jgi:hypothetical protein
MSTPGNPFPNFGQLSLRTVFCIMTLLAVCFAVGAPYLRKLSPQMWVWYGLLTVNLALPAAAGALSVRLKIRNVAARAGPLALAVPGQVKGGWVAVMPALMIGCGLVLTLPATANLALFHPSKLTVANASMRPAVTWLAIIWHVNMALGSALVTSHFCYHVRSLRIGLNLHTRGVVVSGIWFHEWDSVRSYGWSTVSPQRLWVMIGNAQFSIETVDACRKTVDSVFQSHGIPTSSRG